MSRSLSSTEPTIVSCLASAAPYRIIIRRVRGVAGVLCLLVVATCDKRGGPTAPPPTSPSRVAQVRVTPSVVRVEIGDTLRFLATALDSAGGLIQSHGTITWTSSHPAIAQVDPIGLVRGL